MKYFSKINKSEFKINIDEESVVVDRQLIDCSLVPINSEGLHLLLIDGKTYEVFCHKEGSAYEVTQENSNFSVSVDDEKGRHLKKLIKIEDDEQQNLQIKAPMPGLIVKVDVNKGDSVRKGQSLVIIEAMKMENEICAPSNGNITELFVKEKQPVDKEDVLLSLQK